MRSGEVERGEKGRERQEAEIKRARRENKRVREWRVGMDTG